MRHAPCVGIDIYRPPVSLLAICVTFLSQIIYWHMSVYEANNDEIHVSREEVLTVSRSKRLTPGPL